MIRSTSNLAQTLLTPFLGGGKKPFADCPPGSRAVQDLVSGEEEEEENRDRNFLRVARHKWMVSKHVL